MDTSPFEDLIPELEKSLKPYQDGFLSFSKLPAAGCAREEILREMEKLKSIEESRWKEGKVSGAVYHGDNAHIDFLNRVYALHSQSNPLHADIWPSTTKFEAEIVAMTAHMLSAPNGVCGTVTSGGTESILLAMKTYRDWARETKEITAPEMIAPTTAHAVLWHPDDPPPRRRGFSRRCRRDARRAHAEHHRPHRLRAAIPAWHR
jgi:glutamate/tyrosine decarboxylase-like PLP-dependent enzyme